MKNTRQELIGVIVPVYKTKEYIAECIESILAQTYANFRLVLVDDGTPDNAGHICDEYAKRDPRITVIHQQNAGVTRARARGVEETNDCESITFVDSDDSIAADYLEVLHNAMSDNVDIVINERSIGATDLPKEKYIEQLFIGGKGSIDQGPWSKLFRRKLFNRHTFDIPRAIVVGEDMLMNIRLAFASEKNEIVITNNPGIYFYRQNEGSIMHSFKKTPEYEHLFQQYLAASIPATEREHYFRFTIKNRLKSFKKFWGKRCCVKGMKATAFYQELKSDIEKYRYRLPAAEHILFTNENPVIRFFAIIARGVMKVFYKNNTSYTRCTKLYC